jgi:hypothetical protein
MIDAVPALLVIEDVEEAGDDVIDAPEGTLDAAGTDAEETGGDVVGEAQAGSVSFAGGEEDFVEVGVAIA